jgi:TRIAD3 protein (E3 ubiquitin-protein ligase RNF216)
MVRPTAGHHHEVVNLISDDEGDGFSDDSDDFYEAYYMEGALDDKVEDFFDAPQASEHANADSRVFIDLTAISDEDVPPSRHNKNHIEETDLADASAETELITEAVCLQLVLDVLPDISIDHVLTMIRQHTIDQTRTKKHSEMIVNELLEVTYPKEADVARKKRGRQGSEEASDYEKEKSGPGLLTYETDA